MSKKERKVFKASSVRDLAGFILLAATVFIFLSLISYNPMDPSWNTKVAGENSVIQNYGGIVGSHLADLLMQVFGYASYLFPLVMLGAAWAIVFSSGWSAISIRVFGFFVLIFSLSFFLGWFQGEEINLPAWGGALGYWGRKAFVHYLGKWGSFLFCVALFLVALVLAIEFKVKTLAAYTVSLLRVFRKWAKVSFVTMKRLSQRVGKFLDRQEQKLQKDFQEIRTAQEPKISPTKSIRIAGKEVDSFEPQLKPAKSEVPIVLNKAQKAQNMPSFHTGSLEDSRDKKEAPTKVVHEYKLPELDLLEAPEVQELSINREELLANAQTLERKLKDFGVYGKVVEVQPGPVVTMYEFEPAPGVKVNQITRLNDDLALALKAMSVRITPLPGKAVIGIEVANRERQVVYLKDIISDSGFDESSSLLTMALGKDISGTPYMTDLRRMPHLLVAGATGSGKSVCVNSIILSILYKATPEQVRMILVDPKMLELSLYEDIPHLLLPVVTDPRKASASLRWAVIEMERRYRLMADLGVRNIEGYNRKVLKHSKENKGEKDIKGELPLGAEYLKEQLQEGEEHTGTLPFIMIVIDELADLMMVSSREVEESIIRLAQMARAAGIHLLLATQRPSVDVITGVIKANMPARISFQVASKTDSRTILDANGAELLLGAGDMLFLPPGTSKLTRVHGAFVTDNEVKRVTDFWKAQGQPDYDENILKVREEQEKVESMGTGEDDEMYNQALQIVRTHGVASISMIQRKLRIGYNRAARIVEQMEEEGFLAPGEIGKPRQVLLSRFER